MATIATNHEQLDESLTAYAEWHRHEQSVRHAYEAWTSAARPERACRYAAYLEQLDREQRACELYAAVIERRAAHQTAASNQTS